MATYTKEQLGAMARAAARRAGIDPALFEKQMRHESIDFDPAVVQGTRQSSAGAEGIAQIMRKFHPGVDPLDPPSALDYAARLMKSHLDEFDGDYRLALAAYNAGPGAVRGFGGVPPYAETRKYVSLITSGTQYQSNEDEEDDGLDIPDVPGAPGTGDRGVITAPLTVTLPSNVGEWIIAAAKDNAIPNWRMLAGLVNYLVGYSKASKATVEAIAYTLRANHDDLWSEGAFPTQEEDVRNERQKDPWMYAAAQFRGGLGTTEGDTLISFLRQYQSVSPTFGAPSTTGEGTTGDNAPANIEDLYELFEDYLGRPPKDDAEAIGWGRLGVRVGNLREEFRAAPEAKIWREWGTRIREVEQWAASLYVRYTGRAPDNATLQRVVQQGFNPTTLESYLRAQPSAVEGYNLGEQWSARQLAQKWAMQTLGRDVAEGEVNWLLEQNIPINDEHFGAFFEQVKDGAVWAADPETFTDWRERLQYDWTRLGLPGKVPWETVNSAITGNWGPEEIVDFINDQPAPGFAEGVSVGEVNRLREIAVKYKSAIFPGQTVTKQELEKFQGMHPEEIRRYYRSLPAETRFTEEGAPEGNARIGASAMRGPQTEPEKIDIKAVPVEGPPQRSESSRTPTRGHPVMEDVSA